MTPTQHTRISTDPPDQLAQFGDGSDDHDLSMMLDDLESTNTKIKRTHDGTQVPVQSTSSTSSTAASSLPFTNSTNTIATTAADFFNSTLRENLKKIDTDQTLCIHKYASYSTSDKIVKQFCDKLQFIKFVPKAPTPAEIKNIKTVTVEHELSIQCKSDCLASLISYFQNAYFINNMENAIVNRVSLVNVTAPVYQPGFAFSPQVGLETLTKIRQACSLSLQGAACENAVFIKELLLVSTAHLIFTELSVKYKNKTDLRKEVQGHLHLLYVKAKMEYFNKCKPKSFDWPNRPNKIRPIQSEWRTKNAEPPQVPFNRHAQQIIKRVRDGNESFIPETVGNEYSKFLEDGEKLVESFKRRKLAQATSSPPPLPTINEHTGNPAGNSGPRKPVNIPSRLPPPPPPSSSSSSSEENGNNHKKGKRFGLSRVKNSNKSRKATNTSHTVPFSTLTDEIA